MITNGNITIYNQKIVNKKKQWNTTVVENVYIYFKQKNNITVNGMSKVNECIIRIPYSQCYNFVDSEAYKLTEDTKGLYTVGYGDWICLKKTNNEVNVPTEIECPKIQVNYFVNNINTGLPHLHIRGV